MAIAQVTVTYREATEPGALDGWVVTCSICGSAVGSSLKGMADKQAMNHRAWHYDRDLEMQQAVASEVRHMLWRVATPDMSRHDDEVDYDLGALGNVLNVLLHPDHPEAKEVLEPIRAGVDMFLNELRSPEQPSGPGIDR